MLLSDPFHRNIFADENSDPMPALRLGLRPRRTARSGRSTHLDVEGCDVDKSGKAQPSSVNLRSESKQRTAQKRKEMEWRWMPSAIMHLRKLCLYVSTYRPLPLADIIDP
jgi:hypothetical protein